MSQQPEYDRLGQQDLTSCDSSLLNVVSLLAMHHEVAIRSTVSLNCVSSLIIMNIESEMTIKLNSGNTV